MKKSSAFEIVDYEEKYKLAFKTLNKEWIDNYFKMEDADYKALNHPEKYILQLGGAIVVAITAEEPAGVCALIKMKDSPYDFELAKMAVSPLYQGQGVGYLLGEAVINKARELKAKSVYLESNTILVPAINLYHKLGFKEVHGIYTPYTRCNIQMELVLK